VFGGGQYEVPGGHSQKGYWTSPPGRDARRVQGPRGDAAGQPPWTGRCRSVPVRGTGRQSTGLTGSYGANRTVRATENASATYIWRGILA